MTSETRAKRRLKVEAEILVDGNKELELFFAKVNAKLSAQNEQIITQLMLLNERIESAFNTKIKEKDIKR